jgi:hypothetical protein
MAGFIKARCKARALSLALPPLWVMDSVILNAALDFPFCFAT